MFGPELDGYLETWAKLGLIGLEALYPEYEPDARIELTERARRVGLIPSGGSDYHGRYKPGIRLGTGFGDLSIPRRVLEELRATTN